MEKSILIIDTPSECEECPVRGTYGYTGGFGYMCSCNGRAIENEKPSWCPLKPLPPKVDAVPVEWIEKYINECPTIFRENMRWIKIMVANWREENESRMD